MALAFDTLAYAKTLEGAGVPRGQAEAHANAARDFIMRDLVTKEDLRLALEAQTLRLTVAMGAMIAGAAGLIIAALRYLPH
jgi:hypothetical protein